MAIWKYLFPYKKVRMENYRKEDKFMNKKLGSLLLSVVMLTACSKTTVAQTTEENSSEVVNVKTSEMFTERDLKNDYAEEDCTKISLETNTASYDGKGVDVNGSTITITKEGVYLISGTLENGQIVVDVDDTQKVQLILNNVSITNTGTTIYGKNGDKLFITTAQGSNNSLTSTGEFETVEDKNIDGTIYSQFDCTCNGLGTLSISSTGHGIVSKDDLVIGDGTYDIDAAKQGLSGKDSVRIYTGTFTIQSGSDGMQSDTENEEKGFIYINDGNFTITSSQDCISASSYVDIINGNYNLMSGEGGENVSLNHGNDMFRGFEANQYSTSEETVSTKGIKAGGELTISNGTFDMNCEDDAIHGNSNVTIANGTFSIQTGDDAMHSDDLLYIQNGNIKVVSSYEGLEGYNIQIDEGSLDITSSDDGMNAAGGNDGSGMGFSQNPMAGDDSYQLTINGGTIHVLAGGDGLDSNGVITINGGDIWVDGPSDSGNSSIDYGTKAVMNGGTLVAVGSSGMAESFDSSSTQPILFETFDTIGAGSQIVLSDANGNTIISGTVQKSCNSVYISSKDLELNQTYTLTAGTSSQEITLDQMVTGEFGGMGFGGPGGMNQGGPGGMDPGSNRQGGSGGFQGQTDTNTGATEDSSNY